MIQSFNLPLAASIVAQYGGWPGLQRELARLGVDGIEGIWSGEPLPPDLPPGLLTGYHLTFYTDWYDLYRGNKAALCEKFGSVAAAEAFYGGGPAALVRRYREDLARARRLNARYVVFHVSDASFEESYTYRWQHTDAEIVDAAVEIINELLQGVPPEFDFLVENQWWPGFSFTDPALTARLLDAIKYPQKGIMLDTGHLLNCEPALSDQRAGAAYIRKMLVRHGSLCRYIKGVHLHQGFSGDYVRRHIGVVPAALAELDYIGQFSFTYAHVQQIDRHRPWTDPVIAPLLAELAPLYLTHELAGETEAARLAALELQCRTLQQGGLFCDPNAASSNR